MIWKSASKMPTSQKVDAGIVTVSKWLDDNNRFQNFLHIYKSALEQDLIKRDKKYAENLTWREMERNRQKERGFPMPEPLQSKERFSRFCSWDPWLCIYIMKDPVEDMIMRVLSKLTLTLE